MEDTIAERIDLDEKSIWLQFTVHGVEFEVEAFEASDLLADIDTKHAGDPHTCLACFKDFAVRPEDYGRPEEYACPNCKARYKDAATGEVTGKIKLSQVFLDDVIALLKKRFGVKRMSRSEAATFYNVVMANVEAAKKKLEESLKSLSGSESILPDGPNPSDAPS